MVWVSDLTTAVAAYVRVGNNWNYLTIIIDLADRKVVAAWNGWSLSSDMTAENTVLQAWLMVFWQVIVLLNPCKAGLPTFSLLLR